ncbi:hypothetical protein FHT74_002049 [Rhizobium sp. BK109]|nr:hypothetical protein [Rhizobium sp. BK112]MBB4178255.1 hypothetical protein [Rhizobium sp. BK109]
MAMETVEKSNNSNPHLPEGYSLVPKGKLANAVTCLEMTEKPASREAKLIPGISLERMTAPDLMAYRQLFRLVGEDWMWVSRLVMPDDRLTAIINDPLVEYTSSWRTDDRPACWSLISGNMAGVNWFSLELPKVRSEPVRGAISWTRRYRLPGRIPSNGFGSTPATSIIRMHCRSISGPVSSHMLSWSKWQMIPD